MRFERAGDPFPDLLVGFFPKPKIGKRKKGGRKRELKPDTSDMKKMDMVTLYPRGRGVKERTTTSFYDPLRSEFVTK